jgi:hypothetical protein
MRRRKPTLSPALWLRDSQGALTVEPHSETRQPSEGGQRTATSQLKSGAASPAKRYTRSAGEPKESPAANGGWFRPLSRQAAERPGGWASGCRT